jgi:hypothetical protein
MLNLILQPTTTVQEITVSAGELVTVDTASARMGVSVGEREVKTLPQNGRQISRLYLLAPGGLTTIRWEPGRGSCNGVMRFSQATAGGTFGVINSTLEKVAGLGTSRQLQLSMRLNF